MDMIGNMNLRQFWDDVVLTHGARTALIFEDKCGTVREYTYSQLYACIHSAANVFRQLGITKGHKVAVQMHNCPEFFFCWFGLASIGAVIVPLNVHFLHDECAYILEKCAIDTVVTESQFLPLYRQLRAEHDLRHVLLARNHGPLTDEDHVLDFNRLLAAASPLPATEVEPIDGQDTAEILFTSGTTASPKGVVITHHNLCFAGYYTAWQCALRQDDVYLTVMPAFHIDCQCTAALPTFVSGATFVLLEKYSARRFWAQVCLYRATITECIPRIVRTLMLQEPKAWERRHNLREIFYYLTMSDEERDAFTERFKVKLLTSYGMTETIVGAIGDRPGDKRRWPSIGRVGMCYKARVVDDLGEEVPAGVVGHLCIKGEPGKTLFKEYYNDPEASRRTLKAGGWLCTGDSAYVDEEGFFFFVDRDMNMIKRCGENISCCEIENVLTAHPLVTDAAVMGMPDALYDERIVAFVTLGSGARLQAEELLDYLTSRLAHFKIPAVIEFLDKLPRTSTGKVQKYRLREAFIAQNDHA